MIDRHAILVTPQREEQRFYIYIYIYISVTKDDASYNHFEYTPQRDFLHLKKEKTYIRKISKAQAIHRFPWTAL
jgi:hypothetical protein